MLKRLRDLLGRRGKTARDDDAGTRAVTATPPPPVHRGPKVVHRPIPETDLDPDAVKIIRRLTRFDHTAYLVGGCVRDLLLDRQPKDYDIGTSATPRQVKRLFRNCRIIGRRFRLAHVYFQNGKIIEVATFRAMDTQDTDDDRDDDDILIRDDNVFGTPEEDALRRDFTVNQLFYDLNAETVLDHADGLDDLRRRDIRTIGDPVTRFREDPIRILRAIKFAARLDFDIEAGTRAAIDATRDEIPKAAAPRILEEVNRFCRGGAATRSFELLHETGVFDIIFPEYAEVYASDAMARELLTGFLEQIDRRTAAGEIVETGTILAALTIPVVRHDIGWADDGTASQPRGVDIRALTDRSLKPMALRLRASRRDQEFCRQILMSLFRMVPSDRVRATTRRAILRRDTFDASVRMLETVAGRLGGPFADAVPYWKRAASEAEAGGATAAKTTGGDDTAERRPSRRRRRRRSGGGDGQAASKPVATRAKPKPKPKPKPDPDLPPVWDERYFFAALPTVPQGETDAPVAAETVPTVTDEATSEGGAEADADGAPADGGQAPKKRRRRRRRRRKPSSGTPETRGADGS